MIMKELKIKKIYNLLLKFKISIHNLMNYYLKKDYLLFRIKKPFINYMSIKKEDYKEFNLNYLVKMTY